MRRAPLKVTVPSRRPTLAAAAGFAALAASAVLAPISVAGAQRGETTTVRPLAGRGAGRAGLPGRLGRAAQQPAGAVNERQALVRQVRQQFDLVIRRQLKLNDVQWRQLNRVERQFQQQRVQVTRDERQTRVDLKAAMQDTAVDQAKIAQYLDQLVQGQHRRANLVEAEQKELSTLLTPLQRAQYQALHEQLNQRVRQLQGGANAGTPPPNPPPPTPPER